ncbi:MAG: cytochrome c, partial [Chryseobacterium sp.]|nr:cytochrome c [Chryseobacterium sp.]
MISWRKHYKKGLIAISLLLSTGASVYAQGDPKKGQDLFKANCTACHALDKKVVGPALGGIVDKLKKEQNLDTDWLHKWITNNEKLRASGDKYANQVYEENGKVAMQVFEGKLSDADIDDILAYTSNPPAEEPAADKAGETAVDSTASIEAAKAQQLNSKIMIAALIAIAGLLFWLLLKIRQLVKIQQSPELSELDSTRITSFSAL